MAFKNPVSTIFSVHVYIIPCVQYVNSSLSPSLPPFLLLPQVKLLKDVLLEWKKKVDKKPPKMSVNEAYESH